MLHGYRRHLQARDLLRDVLALARADTRAYLQSPPLANTWVLAAHTAEVSFVVSRLGGRAATRELSREAARLSVGPILSPVLKGLLIRCGVSPASIFGNFGLVLRQTARGYAYDYESRGANGGAMTVRVLGAREPPVLAESWAGSLEYVLDVCDVRGKVAVADASCQGDDTHFRYDVRW